MSAKAPLVRFGILAAALAGLAVSIYLILRIGVGPVFSAIARIGWSGFGLVCLLGLALFAVLGSAWFTLIPGNFAPRMTTFIWGRSVRDSAGEVLPFSQLGGFVIGARAVILRGVGAPLAFASTIVDVTTELVAQIAYVLVGIAILVARVPKSSSTESLADTAMIGTLLAALGAFAFLALQRRAFAYAEKLGARLVPTAAAQAGAMHEAIASIHASRLRLFLSACIHLLGWFASAFGAFVALRLMHVAVAFASIVSIEALLCAIRSAAIIVPSALGVQEAAYAMLMPLFGMAAPIGLALSLLRRARDIALGIPVLLVWQAAEGGRALRRTKGTKAPTTGLSEDG